MSGTVEGPCGVPAHRMGRWEDVVLGIWFCPDCGEEIWVTKGVDSAEEAGAAGPDGPALPALPGASAAAVLDARDAAGARPDRAPGDSVGWRDRDGGARLWSLILEAFGRAAE